MSRAGCALVATLFAALAASSAGAAMINLSTHSSDETPPSVLNATMEFEVTGSTLTVTVTNTTAAPNGFKINAIYFNGPAGVSLNFDGMAGWSYSNNVAANGFGAFGFALIDGVGQNPAQIDPGDFRVFSFTILSGAPSAMDFTTHFSTIPPGSLPSIVAARFVGGPGDDSAWGAYIPAPGAAALLLTPLLLGRRRR